MNKFSALILGDKEDLEEFVTMLKEQNIPFSETSIEPEPIEPELKETETHTCTNGGIAITLVAAIIVELTKESIKSIFKWLKEQKKKGFDQPNLEIHAKGNILKLNIEDMKILENILKEATKNKEKQGKPNT
ncbi:MAG: hypothetical protein IBV52_09675 [Candidatus Bathyarchaeota archaeon]